MTSEAGGRAMRVLMHPHPEQATGNPYLELLADGLRRHGVQVFSFGMRQVWTAAPDLVHLHWPEASLGVHRSRVATSRVGRLLLTVTAARLRGVPVLWTVHNLHPHERPHPRLERLFWALFPRLISGWFSLTAAGADEAVAALSALARRPHWITAHGHYRTRYPAPASTAADVEEIAVLLVGHIRAYKNVPALVTATLGTTHVDRLVVAGACHPPSLSAEIAAVASGDARIVLRLGHVADTDLVELLSSATLVVLPYRETLNSGAALLALSFDRPVLLPRSSVYAELQTAVAPGWILLYDGEINASILDRAVLEVQDSAATRRVPALGADFDWGPIADATYAAYREAVGW